MTDEDTPVEITSTKVEEDHIRYDNEEAEYVAPDISSTPLCLVQSRTLTISESPPVDQRENIFHTRCNVKNQVLCVILDGGSRCNLINRKLVDFLQFSITRRSTSYGLNGITDYKEENLITHQCLVHFSIGTYHDKVICDVTDID